MRRGCYPGSFDPLTVAHVRIAEAALAACGLDEIDLVLPADVALGKRRHHHPLAERLELVGGAAIGRPWLRAVVSDRKLLADIAEGYDVLIVGADKWAQVVDPSFYDSPAHRDAAVARLPPVAVAPRHGHPLPKGAVVLDLPAWLDEVSSSAVRSGRRDWRAGSELRDG